MVEPLPFDLAGWSGLRAVAINGSAAPPLVFIHGTNQDHRHFANYMRVLSARGLDCYAFPRRGRDGIPPANALGVRFDEYLADTIAILDHLGRRAILVAHSFGGLLAQKLAEMGRCAAAVLLVPLAPRQVLTRLVAPLPSVPVYLKILRAVIRGDSFTVTYGDLCAISLNRVPESDRRALFSTFVAESGVVTREVLLGIRVDPSRVTCPMLCVSAGEDRFVPARVVRSIAKFYGAEYRELARHGHFILADEGWEEVPQLIWTWLKEKHLVGADVAT